MGRLGAERPLRDRGGFAAERGAPDPPVMGPSARALMLLARASGPMAVAQSDVRALVRRMRRARPRLRGAAIAARPAIARWV